ncbi:MAG TPA: hypothetical protein VHZ95_21385 [Polyangiales bacterium]|nr:hypothetical protein [Polyangiales bacterium]
MTNALTDAQKRLYARQVLVAELGTDGQARLCNAHVALEGDQRAARVALDYLARAGVAASRLAVDGSASIALGSSEAVHATAGDDALIECAAWLRGAFAAVEAIKQVAGIGTPRTLDPQLVLSEVRWRALP